MPVIFSIFQSHQSNQLLEKEFESLKLNNIFKLLDGCKTKKFFFQAVQVIVI